MAVMCIAFSAWGAYDLFVTIPHRAERAQRYETLTASLKQLESARQDNATRGRQPSAEELAEYQRVNDELTAIAPGGKIPSPPSKFDHVVQWIYISCLPFGLWPVISLLRVSKQRYRLEDDGTLHFAGDKTLGSAAWARHEIADIDMSRWMAKSIAWPVHAGGSRLRLDAFEHKNLDQIVGAIASRLYPDAWHSDARPVKAASAEAIAADSHASGNIGLDAAETGDSAATR